MPVALLTLPAVSPTGFPFAEIRQAALADFSYCSSRFTFRVSFLPHSDLCSSSDMTSLPHVCIFSKRDSNFHVQRFSTHLAIRLMKNNWTCRIVRVKSPFSLIYTMWFFYNTCLPNIIHVIGRVGSCLCIPHTQVCISYPLPVFFETELQILPWWD